MRTFDELAQRFRDRSPEPRGQGSVRLLCLRKGDGVHVCPPSVTLSPEHGIDGDRWASGANPNRELQVTLMSAQVAALVAGDHAPLEAAGDNLLVDLDLGEDALPVGSRLRVGAVVLEVSAQPHTGCKKFSARFGEDALRWVNDADHRALRLRGINCRVLEGGSIAVGDSIELVP